MNTISRDSNRCDRRFSDLRFGDGVFLCWCPKEMDIRSNGGRPFSASIHHDQIVTSSTIDRVGVRSPCHSRERERRRKIGTSHNRPSRIDPVDVSSRSLEVGYWSRRPAAALLLSSVLSCKRRFRSESIDPSRSLVIRGSDSDTETGVDRRTVAAQRTYSSAISFGVINSRSPAARSSARCAAVSSSAAASDSSIS